jgi:hypothetical protein
MSDYTFPGSTEYTAAAASEAGLDARKLERQPTPAS